MIRTAIHSEHYLFASSDLLLFLAPSWNTWLAFVDLFKGHSGDSEMFKNSDKTTTEKGTLEGGSKAHGTCPSGGGSPSPDAPMIFAIYKTNDCRLQDRP